MLSQCPDSLLPVTESLEAWPCPDCPVSVPKTRLGKTINKTVKDSKSPPASRLSAMGMTPEPWLEGKEISRD